MISQQPHYHQSVNNQEIFQQVQQKQSIDNQPLTNSKQQTYKSFWSVLAIILNISLSPFYFGYVIAYFSSIDFKTIMDIYGITMQKQLAEGFLMACVPIGGGLGAYASGILLEKFSRRNSLLIVNGLACVAGFLLFIPNLFFLFFARILQGICAGLYSSIAPLMMKQLSPIQLSGTMTTCNQIFIASGIFFAFVFSQILQELFYDQTGKSSWQFTFGFPFIILIIQTIILNVKYKFQTPKYLLLNNQDQKARQLIQRIYKVQYVDKVFLQMKKNLGQSSKNLNDQNQLQKSKVQQMKIQNSSNNQTSRSAFIMAIHLAALQQFCGINAIMAYGGQIVGQSAPSMKLLLPILLNLQQVIASLLTSVLLTRIGRKTLLEIGAIGASITCFAVGVGFFIRQSHPGSSLGIIIVGLVFFMANFGATLGPVVWVYLAEIAQPKVLSLAATVNWVSAAFITLFFPVIKQKLPKKNPALLFIFFSLWCSISFYINKKYLIQTKDKGQKQINEEFRLKKALL